MADEQDPGDEFHVFFQRHHADMARFAFLLTGERDAAEDIAADAFVAVWRRWDHVRTADSPVAYLRRTVANLAITRLRRLIRERRGLGILGVTDDRADGPDVPAVLDVRTALAALPPRKRACVVMRFAFDLSEDETARTLGVSVGTVKSQTSKGLAELSRLLGVAPSTTGGSKTAPSRKSSSRRASSRKSSSLKASSMGGAAKDSSSASVSSALGRAGRTTRAAARRVGVEPRSLLRGGEAV